METNSLPHLTRQLDILNPKCLGLPITIIGAGAIGSFTALSLGKMGFTNLHIWDDDVVSVENMNCQFFRTEDIGKPKVLALGEILCEFVEGSETVSFTPRRFGEKSHPMYGAVVVTVDSMKARKTIWERHKGKPKTELYIDARMSAETALLYAFDPADEKSAEMYEKTLYSDASAMRERCTAKSTMYTVLGVASQICATLKAHVMCQPRLKTLQWDLKAFDQITFTNQKPTDKQGASNG